MRTVFAALLITLSGATLAMAGGGDRQFFNRGDHDWQRGDWNHHDNGDGSGSGSGGGAVNAPEIDPTSTIAALVLLTGGLVVLRSRVRQ